MIVIPFKKQLQLPPPEVLIAALEERFDQDTTITFHDRHNGTVVYSINLVPPAGNALQVDLLEGGRAFSLDGSFEQEATAATVIRDCFGETGRVVAIDQAGVFYVNLTPGMSPEEVMVGWHEVEDWENFSDIE